MEYWIQNIQNGIESVVHANEVQETAKVHMKNTTRDLHTWDHQLYKLTSGAIDAGMGAYGKGSSEAQQLSMLRSKLHRPPAEEEEKPTQ